jgi:hypothetical protein
MPGFGYGRELDGASLCQVSGVGRLYGGWWWAREVTCPKSQRAGFELAALDIGVAPSVLLAALRMSCR